MHERPEQYPGFPRAAGRDAAAAAIAAAIADRAVAAARQAEEAAIESRAIARATAAASARASAVADRAIQAAQRARDDAASAAAAANVDPSAPESERRRSDSSDERHATPGTDEVSRPTSSTWVLIRVAFATPSHADDALATLAKWPDLVPSAELHRCPASHHEMGLIDIFVGPAHRDRVESLVVLLHGIVVH